MIEGIAKIIPNIIATASRIKVKTGIASITITAIITTIQKIAKNIEKKSHITICLIMIYVNIFKKQSHSVGIEPAI